MIEKISTLSQTDQYYSELEHKITELLEQLKSRSARERNFTQKQKDKSQIKKAFASILGESTDDKIGELLNLVFPDTLILPTIYDDPVSFSITSRLIVQVRKAAAMLGFEELNYGGFCCAPTGYVNAMAFPIDIGIPDEHKVFIVFESGLQTFIDGVVRLTMSATPSDLLAGENPADWNAAWDRHQIDSKYIEYLREIGADLRAWLGFFKGKNTRKGLTYVKMSEMRPTELKIVSCMVESAQLFITAHEYVHAIKGHDEVDFDDEQAEWEADELGAKITVAALSQRSDVNTYFSLAGIALAIEAMCIDYKSGDPHPPPAKRVGFVLKAVPFENASHLMLANRLMGIYKRIFHDLIKMPAPQSVI